MNTASGKESLPPGPHHMSQVQQRGHQAQQQQQQQQPQASSLHYLIVELTASEKRREVALVELSKKRDLYPDLAPVLWYSAGAIAALLQEIVQIYPQLSPPALSAHASTRACNALALLQVVASHPETRMLFLNAHIPLYLYPFLQTKFRTRPFEYLRLTSLGVIGALVKVDDPLVINFLLQTEIIPLTLSIMQSGSELSKTVSTFIVQKILLDNTGLHYICQTGERFYAVANALQDMVRGLITAPSGRLLKHIIRCYHRFSYHAQARIQLRHVFPPALRDNTFRLLLDEDQSTKQWLYQVIAAIDSSPSSGQQQHSNSGVEDTNNTNKNTLQHGAGNAGPGGLPGSNNTGGTGGNGGLVGRIGGGISSLSAGGPGGAGVGVPGSVGGNVNLTNNPSSNSGSTFQSQLSQSQSGGGGGSNASNLRQSNLQQHHQTRQQTQHQQRMPGQHLSYSAVGQAAANSGMVGGGTSSGGSSNNGGGGQQQQQHSYSSAGKMGRFQQQHQQHGSSGHQQSQQRYGRLY
eukprot:g297.t1